MKEKPLTAFLEKAEKKTEKPGKREGPWELPEGWRWVRLGEILSFQYGLSKKLSEDNRGYPILRMNNITYDGKLDLSELKFVELSEDEFKKYKLEKGDILINRTNSKELVGKTTVFNVDGDYVFASYIIRGKLKKSGILPEFVAMFLNSPYMKAWFLDRARQAVQMANINARELSRILVPLPPLEEQKRIVAKLDGVSKRIEEAKRLAREAREEAEKLVASALHEVFSKTEERGWEFVTLDRLVYLESGSRPKGGVKDIKEGIPSLGGEHLNWDGSFNFENLKFVPREFYDSMKRGKIKLFDILIVKDGATTGKVAFVDESFPFKKACINEHLFILRKKEKPPKDFLEKFVFYCLMSPTSQEQIRFIFSGSAQGGINQRFAKFLKIPLPSLEEQKRIVAYLDKISEHAQKLVKLYEERERELERLFPAVLDRAFRGEI